MSGRRGWGLQRVVYTGVPPFDVLTMRARADGFVLTFTEAIDPASVESLAGQAMASFTYERWEKYGSPEIDRRTHARSTSRHPSSFIQSGEME